MLKAYLHPKKKPNDRHWYAYDVVFDGELLVTDSRDPEHISLVSCWPAG